MSYYAILFMDIRGYSELTVQSKEKIHRFLSEFEIGLKNIDRPIGEPDCTVPFYYFNTWGDAVIALFDSADTAMRAYVQLKGKFDDVRHSLQAPGLLMRVVMHWGKVYRLASGAFFGDELITAARIEPLVEAGEVWLTEEFKNELDKVDWWKEKGSIGVPDGGAEYLLPKGWGLRKIYKLRDTGEIDPPSPNSKYVEIKFRWQEDCINMQPLDERDLSVRPISDDERASLIEQMQRFLSQKIDSVNTYCAIGIQNFLELDGLLCVGVRMKTKVNKELPHYKLIAMQSFNTGYKLLQKTSNFPNDAKALQDLFKRPQQQAGEELPEKQLTEIQRKGIDVLKIKIGDASLSCVTSINYSYDCPRFEIGICRLHRASTAAIRGAEKALSDFGSDDYGMKEGTYWLWIRDGKIRAFSFYSIRGIRGTNILLPNRLGNALYTPFVSDELLAPKDVLIELFSSPARALLEKF